MMSGGLALLAALAFPGDAGEVLARASARFLDATRRLPNYTCVQTVDRKYFRPSKPRFPVASCEEMIAGKQRNLRLEATDRLRLEVKVSDGVEIASWPGASRFESRSVVELIGGGPFGTGPFGTLLWDIFASGGSGFQFTGEERADGGALLKYGFQVARESSHSYFQAGRDWIAAGYQGAVWIDPVSLDPRRLSVRTVELPEASEGCQVTTAVEYARLAIGTGDFLVPLQSTLQILMRDGGETQSVTAYSCCREYHAESSIRFEEAQEHLTRQRTAAAVPLPAGLTVRLAFAQPVETDTAAAGDVVLATVREPVREKRSNKVLVPAGATVRGRIVQMQHWVNRPGYFLIAILLESLESDGASAPFYASRLDDSSSVVWLPWWGKALTVSPPAQAFNVSAFVFPSSKSRYTVPPGYASRWVTVEPPGR
jgi:hypothetical protein